MYSFNQIILIGKVYDIKVMKTRTTGEDVVKASIQYQHYRNKKNENIYFDIVLFEKNAKLFKDYVKQADVIQVVGKLIYDTYENKEGKNMRAYKVVVDKFMRLRAAYADELKEDEAKLFPKENSNISIDMDDDIPF
jgi:single-stranded DNA-binding protein